MDSITLWRKVVIKLMLIITLPLMVYGQTEPSCSANDFYCYNSTHGEVCVEGLPLTGIDLYECVTPTVCSMTCPQDCTENTDPCTVTTIAPTTTEITTTEPPTTTEIPSFVCQTAGRFPDLTDCSKYFLCTPNSGGGFYQYNYTCPGTALFNPVTSKCVVGTVVDCPNSESITTTTPSTSTSTSITTNEPFTCITQGRFPNPSNTNQYYLCVISAGQLVYYVYSCPNSSIFNAATGKCVVQ